MKFPNLSPPEDFNLKLQTNLEILMKNVLYITHELDAVKRLVISLNNSTNLQKQVDEYFTKDNTNDIPEVEEV